MPHTKEELSRLGIKPRDIEHNQHRRAQWLDYGDVGLYMITMCVEGRKPVFGHRVGNWRAARGSEDFPHIVRSALAQRIINEELPKISRKYPQVEVWQATFMPDHIHLLIYVRSALPKGKHLGHVIGAFKGGCSRQGWGGAHRVSGGNSGGAHRVSGGNSGAASSFRGGLPRPHH